MWRENRPPKATKVRTYQYKTSFVDEKIVQKCPLVVLFTHRKVMDNISKASIRPIDMPCTIAICIGVDLPHDETAARVTARSSIKHLPLDC